MYLDRFFTKTPLPEALDKISCLATGTIMGNRVPKSIKFPLDKEVHRRDICQFTEIPFNLQIYNLRKKKIRNKPLTYSVTCLT